MGRYLYLIGKSSAVSVIVIYHRRATPFEKRALCGEVVFHIFMEIEVILAEIGKNSDLKVYRLDLAQRQRV